MINETIENYQNRPLLTVEDWEQYGEILAYKQAVQMLEQGTAPPAIVVHFLKMSTQEAAASLSEKRAKARLAEAKANQIDSERSSEELYSKAIAAFKRYSGDRSDET